MKLKSNKYYFILGVALMAFVVLLWTTRCWDEVVKYRFEKLFMSKVDEKEYFNNDIDGDGVAERVIYGVRSFSGGKYFNEGFVTIIKQGDTISRLDLAGWEIQGAWLADLNDDNKLELISKWAEGNVSHLYIHCFEYNKLEELLWASGQDVRIGDLEQDGLKEIFEYYRDYEKPFNTYVVNVYCWIGGAYVLWKQHPPIQIDSTEGDRLIFGDGKIAVLK